MLTKGTHVQIRHGVKALSKYDRVTQYAGKTGNISGVYTASLIGTTYTVDFPNGDTMAFHPEELDVVRADDMCEPCLDCGHCAHDDPDELGCGHACHTTKETK